MIPSAVEPATRQIPIETSNAAGIRFLVVEGPNPGGVLVVNRSRHTVGRHSTNDLVVEDPGVSLVHLEVFRVVTDRVLIRDAGTTNGTWLGEHRLVEAQLATGAVLRIGTSKLRVEADPSPLHAVVSEQPRFEGLVGQTTEMRELFAVLERIAPKTLSVLFEGETGTGKEEAARALHARSRRKDGPFIVLDAATIPITLAESTLFGHERGAFTGADYRHIGAFERAAGGTIFIDEVGELPAAIQAKLLRVLERREIVRVGGKEPIEVDVRVITATHRDLRKEVEAGNFRDDLYFRLAQVRLTMPPLRTRKGDITLLAKVFLESCLEPSDVLVTLDAEALEELTRRPWPGNVRELKNALLRGAALCEDGIITKADIGTGGYGFGTVGESQEPMELIGTFAEAKNKVIERFEKTYLEALIHRTRGNLSKASRDSGIARNHLRDLLRKRGLYEPVRG